MLKFNRTHAGRYYAKGAEHTYLVYKPETAKTWFIRVCKSEIFAGVVISGEEVWHDYGFATKADALRVLNAFEADADAETKSYLNRSTRAMQAL